MMVFTDLQQSLSGPLQRRVWLPSDLCLPWLLSLPDELVLSADARLWAAQHALLLQHAVRFEPAHLQ